MKLIAVAKKGKEFVHSTERAYFAPDSSADRIADLLNEKSIRLTMAKNGKYMIMIICKKTM